MSVTVVAPPALTVLRDGEIVLCGDAQAPGITVSDVVALIPAAEAMRLVKFPARFTWSPEKLAIPFTFTEALGEGAGEVKGGPERVTQDPVKGLP